MLEKNYDLTGIGIGLKQRSGLRDRGEIFSGMAGLKNPIGDPLCKLIIRVRVEFRN